MLLVGGPGVIKGVVTFFIMVFMEVDKGASVFPPGFKAASFILVSFISGTVLLIADFFLIPVIAVLEGAFVLIAVFPAATLLGFGAEGFFEAEGLMVFSCVTLGAAVFTGLAVIFLFFIAAFTVLEGAFVLIAVFPSFFLAATLLTVRAEGFFEAEGLMAFPCVTLALEGTIFAVDFLSGFFSGVAAFTGLIVFRGPFGCAFLPFLIATEVLAGFFDATAFKGFFIAGPDFAPAGFDAVFGFDSFVTGAFRAFIGFLLSGFFAFFAVSVIFFFADAVAVLAGDLDVV